MSDIIIRRANENDCDRLIALLEDVHNLHADIRPDLYIEGSTKYSREELIDHMNQDGNIIFVATRDDYVVGYMFTEIHSITGNNLKSHKELYIDDLCVDKSARGMGIAKRLYEYTKDFARDNGCYNITLNVWEGNDGARRFYELQGMFVRKTMMEEIL